jgi:hypothetical protein
MCLLSIGLDTLGLLLRIWLWISVPMAVIILLVATWMNYVRNLRPKGNLRLAVEGLGGEVSPGGGEMFVGRDEVVGEGEVLRGESGETAVDVGGEGPGDREELDREELDREEPVDREELTETGKETIYQGILWMKEKYEQYREQADLRYEGLREELGRSERRYQELLATMEQSKSQALGMVTVEPVTDNRQELDAKQGIIEDLEAQLRSERMKVEELVLKLQANSQLLLTIYQELDKSFHVGQSFPDFGK